MKKLAFFFVFLFSFTAGIDSASAITFRRPLNTVLSPAVSYYYDNDTGPDARRYTCDRDRVYHDHEGTDFRATVGTPIYASAAGGLYYRYDNCDTYGYLGSKCGGGFGNHVRIDHEGVSYDGRGWVTIYGHMQQRTAAYEQSLRCSTYIGRTGSSGNSTGPHLHFEVRKYSYPNNDPFAGSCSGSGTFWTSVSSTGVPGTMCGR